MKKVAIGLLVWAVLIAGCTVWIQAAGRSASNSHYGNTQDNSNGVPPSGKTSGTQEGTEK